MKWIALLLLLSACVGPQTINKVDSSVGMTEDELLGLMGAPSSKIEMGETTVYQYVKDCRTSSTFVPVGFVGQTVTTSGCKVFNFYAKGKRVVKSDYEDTTAKLKYRSKTGW